MDNTSLSKNGNRFARHCYKKFDVIELSDKIFDEVHSFGSCNAECKKFGITKEEWMNALEWVLSVKKGEV